MKIIQWITILCVSMVWSNCFSQFDTLNTSSNCSITFKGKIVDGESNEPLFGASVLMKGTSKGAISNDKGEFVIHSICSGTYIVECSAFGYKPVSQSLTLSKSLSRNFILHSDTCVLESIVIVTKVKELENTQPVLELKGIDLDRTRGLSLGEAVKNLPGVNTIQTGPTIFKPVIQGMYGNRVLIMNNGVRMEGQQWGAEHAPEIDPFIADKITVIKGAAGVKYGTDAIAGVILIDPRDLRQEPGIGGELNLVGFSNNREGVASGFLDYSVKKIKGLSFRTQGTLKRGGNFKTPDYYLKNTGLYERNFSLTAGYTKEKFGLTYFYSQFNSTNAIFSASHIGNLADLQKAINSSVPLETSGFTYNLDRPYQEVSHELAKIGSYYKFNKIGRLDIVFARQFNDRAEFDKHRPFNNDLGSLPQSRFKITTHTANIGFTHYRFKNFTGEFGVNLIHQKNTTRGTTNAFIPNFRSLATGIYLIERWRIDKLEIEGGMRYDMKTMEVFKYENNVLISPRFNFSKFSGTLGSVYEINKHLKANINLSNAFRIPTVNELFSDGLHHGAARIEIGDRNLKPEVSYSATVSLKYKFKHAFGELTAYHNYVKDYIYLSPLLKYVDSANTYVPDFRLTVRGAFPAFRYQQIDATFTGVDFTINDYVSERLLFSTKLSLLRAYNQTSRSYLILTPPANMENGLKYNFKFSKKLINTYVKGSTLIVLKKYKVRASEDFKAPPPSYMLLNLEAGFTIMAGKQPMDFTLSVYNALNTRYRDYLDRFRYFAEGVGRNIALRVKLPLNFTKNESVKKQ